MAAKKSAAEVANMTDEERAQLEARREAARKPRPAYIAFKLEDGHVVPKITTRNANDLLAAVQADRDLQYITVEIK